MVEDKKPGQQRLFKEPIQIALRRGDGAIIYEDGYYPPPCEDVVRKAGFADFLRHIERVPRKHSGWQSVRHKGKRYQLFGGIRTEYFICLNSPI